MSPICAQSPKPESVPTPHISEAEPKQPVEAVAHPAPNHPQADPVRPIPQPSTIPAGSGRRATALALLGLSAVAAAAAAAAYLGEFDRIGGFIFDPTDAVKLSTLEAAYYPSISGCLGVVMAGPAGVIFATALGLCTCLGLAALWSVRGRRPRLWNRGLPLAATLLLPLLTLNFMIFSAIECAGVSAMPLVFDTHPERLQFWVPVALGCSAVLSLACDLMILRWAWCRELRCGVKVRRKSFPRPVTLRSGLTYPSVSPT